LVANRLVADSFIFIARVISFAHIDECRDGRRAPLRANKMRAALEPLTASKLRFEVEAQRSPAASRFGFIARHIEQPVHATQSRGEEKSCRALRLGCAFTRPEPAPHGVDPALTACRRPDRRRAQISMAALVQEPMNNRSMSIR